MFSRCLVVSHGRSQISTSHLSMCLSCSMLWPAVGMWRLTHFLHVCSVWGHLIASSSVCVCSLWGPVRPRVVFFRPGRGCQPGQCLHECFISEQESPRSHLSSSDTARSWGGVPSSGKRRNNQTPGESDGRERWRHRWVLYRVIEENNNLILLTFIDPEMSPNIKSQHDMNNKHKVSNCPSKTWQWGSMNDTRSLKPKQLNGLLSHSLYTCVVHVVTCPRSCPDRPTCATLNRSVMA